MQQRYRLSPDERGFQPAPASPLCPLSEPGRAANSFPEDKTPNVSLAGSEFCVECDWRGRKKGEVCRDKEKLARCTESQS
ncbi:hypothetical protein JOQ06_027595 [Pogonophryne albipinna]|uniref:Uncharacterized protein n=1 Tax=Pogonophryne albipinna TaxID=1090488 RepID=A0AAD6BCB0_9TELE|nr:hypothetical protein JOQ06_027595 [Pogonophryne albipinna]